MLSSGNIKKIYRCKTWEDDEVQILIPVWKEYYNKLKSQKRNSAIYKKMAEDLNSRGLLKAAKEIQMKVKNLSSTFRKEKTAMSQNGGSPSTWKFFPEIAEFFDFSSCNDTEPLVRDVELPANYSINEPIEFDGVVYNGVHVIRLESVPSETVEEVNSSHVPNVTELGYEITEIPLEVNNENRKRNIEECLQEMDAKYKKAIIRLQKADKEIISLVKETNSLMKEQNNLFREQNDLIRQLIKK